MVHLEPHYAGLSCYCWGVLLAGSALATILSTLCLKVKEWIFCLFVDMMFCSLGAFLLATYHLPAPCSDTVAHTYLVQLQSEPILRNGYYRADAVILVDSDGSSGRVEDKILVNFSADSLLHTPCLFDRYFINSRLSLPPFDGNSRGFDYGKYLRRKGYSATTYLYQHNFAYVSGGEASSVGEYFQQWRAYLLGIYRDAGIDQATLALVSAITLGEKGMLSVEQKEAFSAAGVQHVLVVSGMHVGFIYLVIIWLVRRCGRMYKRRMITVLGLFVLWGYAFITGLAPAVVRATTMFSIMLLFYVGGIRYRMLHALSIAAIISLLANPYLLFDVGFWLSYTAVLSISSFYPSIYGAYKRLKIKSKILDSIVQPIAVTVSAQILTLPIVVYSFGQFPLYFVVTNIIASFFVPIIFALGMLSLSVFWIPYLGSVVAGVLSLVVRFFDASVSAVASIPGSTADAFVSMPEMVLMYIFISLVINIFAQWKSYYNRIPSVIMALCGTIVILVADSFMVLDRVGRTEMMVMNRNRLCVNLLSDDTNIVFAVERDTLALMSGLHLLDMSMTAPPPIFVVDTTLSANAFRYQDETYVILRDNVFRYKYNKGNPLSVDCLIIDRGVYPSEKLFDSFISPRRVHLTASVWDGYLPVFASVLEERGIELTYD